MIEEVPSLFGVIHAPLCYVMGKRLSNSTSSAVRAAALWATQKSTAPLASPFTAHLVLWCEWQNPEDSSKNEGGHWSPSPFCCMVMGCIEIKFTSPAQAAPWDLLRVLWGSTKWTCSITHSLIFTFFCSVSLYAFSQWNCRSLLVNLIQQIIGLPVSKGACSMP